MIRLLPLLALLIVPEQTFGQTVLLREFGPSPDGVAGRMVLRFGKMAVNREGGYACQVICVPGNNTALLPLVWGNLSGGPGEIIRGTIPAGQLLQGNFDEDLGVSTSSICYGAILHPNGGPLGLDSLWIDDTMVGAEELQAPGTNEFVREFSRQGITENGEPYFFAGLSATPTGTVTRRALFFGTTFTPVYESGGVYPNLPMALGQDPVAPAFAFSPSGAHHIAKVNLGSAGDVAMVLDGEGLLLGGALVQLGSPVPAALGGTGETWERFDDVAINDGGEYVFTGTTRSGSSTRPFTIKNGQMLYRGGDTLDGEILGEAVAIAINAWGDVAGVWRIEDGAGFIDAIFFEGQKLMETGDRVDWDGDGTVDPLFNLGDVPPGNNFALTDRGTLYFLPRVVDWGIFTEVQMRLETPRIGNAYCSTELNSTGTPARLRAEGLPSASANDVTLQAESLPPNEFGIFLVSQAQDFVPGANGASNGNLCLGGSIGRLVGPGQILSTGPTGAFTMSLDLTSIPQGSGTVAVASGETWNFQGWFRDGPGLGSNFTEGYSITFL